MTETKYALLAKNLALLQRVDEAIQFAKKQALQPLEQNAIQCDLGHATFDLSVLLQTKLFYAALRETNCERVKQLCEKIPALTKINYLGKSGHQISLSTLQKQLYVIKPAAEFEHRQVDENYNDKSIHFLFAYNLEELDEIKKNIEKKSQI